MVPQGELKYRSKPSRFWSRMPPASPASASPPSISITIQHLQVTLYPHITGPPSQLKCLFFLPSRRLGSLTARPNSSMAAKPPFRSRRPPTKRRQSRHSELRYAPPKLYKSGKAGGVGTVSRLPTKVWQPGLRGRPAPRDTRYARSDTRAALAPPVPAPPLPAGADNVARS